MNEVKQEENKIDKKFAAVMNKLTAVVNGASNLKPIRKIENQEMSGLVEELFKEERQALLVQTKDGLKSLLKQYHELLKTVRQKKDELEKLELQKKEEFVKAANALFDKIQDVDALEESYASGLSEIAKS